MSAVAVAVPRRSVLLLALLLPLTAAGCAGIAREVAREGSPGGVEGALSSADDPGKQQQLGDILDGPTGEGLGRGFTRGAVAEAVALAVGATQPSPRPTTSPSASNSEQTYAWATADAPDRPTPTVRNVVRDAALGLNDAFAQPGHDGNDGGVLAGTRDVLGTIMSIALAVAAILVLLVVALALSVWHVLAKARTAREEARLHEAGTARLLDALRAIEGRPWAPEFQAVLRESLERPAEEVKRSKKQRTEGRDNAETDWRREERNGKEVAAQGIETEYRGRVERAAPD